MMKTRTGGVVQGIISDLVGNVEGIKPLTHGQIGKVSALSASDIFTVLKTLRLRSHMTLPVHLGLAHVELPNWVLLDADEHGDESERFRRRFLYLVKNAGRHERARLLHAFDVNGMWANERRAIRPYVGIGFMPSIRTDSFGMNPLVPAISARVTVVSSRTDKFQDKSNNTGYSASFDLRVLPIDFDVNGCLIIGAEDVAPTRIFNWSFMPAFGAGSPVVDLDQIDLVENGLALTRAMCRAAYTRPVPIFREMNLPEDFDLPKPWLVFREDEAPQFDAACPKLHAAALELVAEWCCTGQVLDESGFFLRNAENRMRERIRSVPLSFEDVSTLLTAEELTAFLTSVWCENQAEDPKAAGYILFTPEVVKGEDQSRARKFLDFSSLLGRSVFNATTGQTETKTDLACSQVCLMPYGYRSGAVRNRHGRVIGEFAFDVVPETAAEHFADYTDEWRAVRRGDSYYTAESNDNEEEPAQQ